MTGGVPQPSLAFSRHHDPDTSKEAAFKLDTTAVEQLVVLKLRELYPGSATAEELSLFLKVDRVTISPRMRPLCDKGLVRDTGRRRHPKTPKGEKKTGAILWQAVPEGERRVVRVITLGNGKQVRLGNYVAGWKRAKKSKRGTRFNHGLCGWWSLTREEILREFNEGLHDRINRHIPWFGKGRKWNQDWQREMGHAAFLLNNPKLIIDWLPQDLKVRFARRLRNGND